MASGFHFGESDNIMCTCRTPVSPLNVRVYGLLAAVTCLTICVVFGLANAGRMG